MEPKPPLEADPNPVAWLAEPNTSVLGVLKALVAEVAPNPKAGWLVVVDVPNENAGALLVGAGVVPNDGVLTGVEPKAVEVGVKPKLVDAAPNPTDVVAPNPEDTLEPNPVDVGAPNPIEVVGVKPVDVLEPNALWDVEPNPPEEGTAVEPNPADVVEKLVDKD